MQSFIKGSLGCIRDKTGSIFCLSGTRIKPKKKSFPRFFLFFALFARVDNFLNVKYAEKTSRYCSNHFSNLHHNTGTYIYATSSIGNGRVPAYSHNQLALNNFFATRPDLHSTISVIAWYLTLKNWNFSVCTRISTRNLNIFEPTRPDSTRPFDTRSDSYSTNLPLAHSLLFRENSRCDFSQNGRFYCSYNTK